jgi:hypothetical protein
MKYVQTLNISQPQKNLCLEKINVYFELLTANIIYENDQQDATV